MPLPAILGLPALVTFLTGVVTAFVTWVVNRLTFKIAIYLVVLAAMAAALNEFFTTIAGNVGQLMQSAPPELQAAAFFLPSNTGLCISLILASEVAAAIYDLTMTLIRMKFDAA